MPAIIMMLIIMMLIMMMLIIMMLWLNYVKNVKRWARDHDHDDMVGLVNLYHESKM